MFEGLIASILNRFFSGYIDEIDYKNLQIGLISGSVELKNLALKPDALYQFDVPIEVKCSRVGRLHVRVPWRSIYAEPVVISIEDVYVLLAPMTARNLRDPEKINRVSVAAKRKQVKQLNRGIIIDEKQVDRGFFKTLFDTVLNNIQIHVMNIHVRYEDSTSVPAVLLSVGATLEEVLLTTTDENGKQIQLDSEAEFVFKIGQMKCCDVYFNAVDRRGISGESRLLIDNSEMCDDEVFEALQREIGQSSKFDHKHDSLFMKPLSMSATVKLNRFRHEHSLTKPHITMNTELDGIDLQLSMDQLVSFKALIDHYRITLRNSNYVKYRPKSELKDDPREWWKYAYTSIVEERVRSYNWDRMKSYREQYRQYKKLYKEILVSHSISDQVASEMDALELKLNLPSIMIARQHAKIECKYVHKDAVYILSTEEKNELYEMIGFKEQVGSDDKALTELLAQLDISSVSFSLSDKNTSLLRFEFGCIASELSVQPAIKSGNFRFEFNSLSLYMNDGKDRIVPLLKSITNPECNKVKLMHFEFLKHSINSNAIADYDISFGLRPVEIIYEFAPINYLLNTLKSSTLLEMIASKAGQNLAKLSNYSTAGLIYAIENHKRFKLNALVHSPLIIIPQNGSRGGNGIVIYLGKAQLSSNLTTSSINDPSHITKNMYDTFNLHISNAQVLMCDTSSEFLFNQINEADTECRILKPASLDAVLLLSIRPSCYSLPQLIVKSNIGCIDFIISDETIIMIHKFLIDLPIPKFSSIKQMEFIKYDEDVFYDPSYDTVNISLDPHENQKDSKDISALDNLPTPLSQTDDVWSDCFLGEDSSYTDLKENYTKYMVTFKMEKATVHIREAKLGSYLRLGMNRLNCDLAVTAFGAAIAISVGGLQVLDVQNNSDVLETSNNDLITLKYRFISKRCPSYSKVYKSLPHFAKLQFNNLCFVCRQEFLVKLIRFAARIMKKVAKQGILPPKLPQEPSIKIRMSDVGDAVSKVSGIKVHFTTQADSSVPQLAGSPIALVECSFNMFAWRIVQNDIDIATVLIQGLSVEAGLKDNFALCAKAALKDLAVRSVTRGLYSDVVNLLDDNVFDASVEYAEKSLRCSVNVGRLRVIFLYKFYKDLLDFVSLLSSVNADLTKSVLNQARESVYRQFEDVSVQGQSFKQDLHLEVHVNAPSIIVPRNGISRHAFIIQMGTLDVNNGQSIEQTGTGKAFYTTFNLSLQSVEASRAYVASDDTIEVRECVLFPIGFEVNVSLLQRSKSVPSDGAFIPIKIFSRVDLIRIEISLPSAQLLFAILDDNILAVSSSFPGPMKQIASSSTESESSELNTISSAVAVNETPIKTSIEIEFSLLLVGASAKIIETIAQAEASIGDVCLLTISTSKVVLRTHPDETIDADIMIGYLSIKDVRADSNLAVRDVIEPIEEPRSDGEDKFFYAVLRYTADKDLIITFKLEKLKINMCLPFLLYLERFIMNTVFYVESGIVFDAVSEGGRVIKLIDQNTISTEHKFAVKPTKDFDALTYGEASVESSSTLRSISINGNLDLPDVAILTQPTKTPLPDSSDFIFLMLYI